MKNVAAWIATTIGVSLAFVSATTFGYLLWGNWIKLLIYYGGRDTHYTDGGPDLGRGIGMAIIGGGGILCGVTASILAYAGIRSTDRIFQASKRAIYFLGFVGVVLPILVVLTWVTIDWSQPLRK